MLKLLGAALLTVGGAWAGLRAAGELADRVKALEAWQDALTLLRGELAFRLPAMPELTAVLSQRSREPARGVFAQLEQGLERLGELSFAELWSAAVADHAGALAGEDVDALRPLGDLLGRCGWEDQCEAVERVCRELERRRVQAREELDRKGKAYGTLGLGLGAFLTILLL